MAYSLPQWDDIQLKCSSTRKENKNSYYNSSSPTRRDRNYLVVRDSDDMEVPRKSLKQYLTNLNTGVSDISSLNSKPYESR